MMASPPSLSVLATCDDLFRSQAVLSDGLAEKEFLRFALNQEQCRLQWLSAVKETWRLKQELETANNTISVLEGKLRQAQKLMDGDKRKYAEMHHDKMALERQIIMARDLLFSDNPSNKNGVVLNNETLDKLAFLHKHRGSEKYRSDRLNTITEMNNTGSLISDLSYSRSEDDLDRSSRRKWNRTSEALDDSKFPKKRRSSGEHRRRSPEQKKMCADDPSKAVVTRDMELNPNEKVVATTTLTVSRDGQGPIVARSVIEAVPDDDYPQQQFAPSAPPKADIDYYKRDVSPSSYQCNIIRPHTFMPKTMIKPEVCMPCGKRIRFGKISVKCRECRAIAHSECRDVVPLPCVPVGNTPTIKGSKGSIADYTPLVAPMVPSLIVHCVNEVEQRGLNEVGIYRVPGADKEVKALKERFLKGKGAPSLSNVDIHVICGCLKDFLRALKEPLITHSSWQDFVKCYEDQTSDSMPSLYRAILDLPQPNRDTLAFLIMHLQRVAECTDCMMPVGNIARVFGPTVVGYSCQNPDPSSLLTETGQAVGVMERLLTIPTEYWASFICVDIGQVDTPKPTIPQTPSTDSLGKFFSYKQTPVTREHGRRKQRKQYFATPPTLY